MNKLNIFDPNNPFFHYRWFIILIIAGIGVLIWYDSEGDSMFGGSNSGNSYSTSSTRTYYHK